MRYFNRKNPESSQAVKSADKGSESNSVSRKEIQNYINHLGLDQHQQDFIKQPKTIDSTENSQKESYRNESASNVQLPEKFVNKNTGSEKRTKSKNKFKIQSNQQQETGTVIPQNLDKNKRPDLLGTSGDLSGRRKEDIFVNSKKESNNYLVSRVQLQDKFTTGISSNKNDTKYKNKFKNQLDQPQSSRIVKPQILDYKKRTYLLAKPGNRWYDQSETLNVKASDNIPSELVSEMENLAIKLLQDEVELYIKQFQRQRLSDFQWIKTVTVRGTLVDKMAALTIMIQDSPIHNLSSIDTLLNMSKKKERRENVIAMTTLKDLFITDLLPSNQKLKKFSQHPLNELTVLTSGNKDHRDKYLLYWYFEHQLKERYCDFLKSLEAISFDPVESSKTKAVSSIFWLLSNRSEQEQVLLTMLTNKLGDPINKIASKAAHFLVMLVSKHSRMKFVVALEVERLLYRPNISPRAQYYAVCFLNQLMFDPEDVDLATRLITIYLSFFKILVKKKEVDSKMLSALLTGVNRAYPFTKGKSEAIIEEIPTLFKIVYTVNFNVAVQTLMLLYQLLDVAESIMDRFYTALYRKILDSELLNCPRQTMFLNLLYKSLKKDTVMKRTKAFVKRLLQICDYHQPPFVCGVLILLSELIRCNPELFDVTAYQEDLGDEDDDEHFVDLEAPDSDMESEGIIKEKKTSKRANNSVCATSWVHRKNLLGKQTERQHYDPYYRNPLYCGAEYSIFWELHNLNKHYHPSVALFAQKILTGSHIVYSGDPLEDFTSMHFLERFVYRNPKSIVKTEKPIVSLHAKKAIHTNKAREVAVYSNDFITRKESNISPDEVFLYRYLTERKIKINEKDSDESDTESIPDAEFDMLLDKLENDKKSAYLDLDFAGEFQKHIGDKKKKKGEDVSESEEDFEEEDDDVEFDDEEFKAAFKEFDMSPNEDGEDPEFEDLDEVELGEELGQPKKSAKPKKPRNAKKQKIAPDLNEEDFEYSDDDEFNESKRFPQRNKKAGNKSLFAAAEKFSFLLEGADEGNYDTSGSHAFSNKDNSKMKQLKWEMERDRWVRGVDWKSKKRMKSKKQFSKKNKKY